MACRRPPGSFSIAQSNRVGSLHSDEDRLTSEVGAMRASEFQSEYEFTAHVLCPFPPDRVWQALTREAEMLHWLGVTGECVIASGQRFWYRNYILGYEAHETLEADPPRRIVHRGLFTRRLRIWYLLPQIEGTQVRSILHPGPSDDKWEYYLKAAAGGWAFILECLRAYLEGRFDLQAMPHFGIRTRLVEATGDVSHIVTRVAAWAQEAGVQVDDLLLAINDERLTTEGLNPFRLKLRAEDVATLTVQRGPGVLQVPLRLPSWRRVVEIQSVDVGPPPGWISKKTN